jgi:L-threonylcarbamoyladenylate synthase
MALVSTSAIEAGKRPIKDARTCVRVFGQPVLMLRGRIGQRKRPSRIIDPRSGKNLQSLSRPSLIPGS